MHRSTIPLVVGLAGVLVAFTSARRSASPNPAVRRAAATIAANDNRRSAGTLRNGVLTVRLEARTGTWYPEGDKGVGLETAAWAEVGKPLQNPGPAIRVPVGTVVKASIHNTLAKPLTVYGFGAARGAKDTVAIAPGATRRSRSLRRRPSTSAPTSTRSA